MKKLNVTIILFPWASKAPCYFLEDILKILTPITNNLYVIAGESCKIKCNNSLRVLEVKSSVHYAGSIKPIFLSYFLWVIKAIWIQIKFTMHLFRIINEIDVVIYMAYPFNFLPLIVSKIFGKKNIGYINRTNESRNNYCIDKFFQLSNSLDFWMMDKLSPQSKSIIQELNMDKYSEKITEECGRFVSYDENVVKITDRKKLVGYVGRLKREKGIVEFIKSIPLIFTVDNNVSFFIAGSGDLSEWVESEIEKIKEEHFGLEIEFIGWIPREDIYKYLSSLKILVMPTIAEGLPTIMLEAILSYTPVLTTPVGGIPDIIQNEKTGFILHENTAEAISINVIKILGFEKLDEIVENARKIVENKYSYERAVERWEIILES